MSDLTINLETKLPAAPSPQRATWAALFDSFKNLNILVVGDLMLDRYLWGRVTRISPEAPVPIVDVQQEENRLGGAANVAMNLQRLGCNATLCGTIGQDTEAQYFMQVMAQVGLGTSGLVQLAERRTTTKIRIIGNHQQIARVDKEESDLLPEAVRGRVWQHIEKLLNSQHFHALIFEDYDKGLLDAEIIEKTTKLCAQKNIPVMVDPKRRNFFFYKDCTVFKPNVKELNDALGTHFERKDMDGIKQAVQILRHRMPHACTLVTLSEHGVLVCDAAGKFTHTPAHYRQIVDVSGAGDTVIGVMAAAVAAGCSMPVAAQVANLAGGLVCEEVGVVPIDKEKLLAEVQRLAK